MDKIYLYIFKVSR